MKRVIDKLKKYPSQRKNDRGVAAVIVAICLVMLIGFAALAIDVGHLYATRNELQNVADAAALAGAGELGRQYGAMSYVEQQNPVLDFDAVRAAAGSVAYKNHAAGTAITINAGDIVIGIWDGNAATLTPTLAAPDAVRVTARRDAAANAPVNTFFARVLGVNTVNVSARATAALTGPATIEEGELRTPFSLSENVFPNNCTDLIAFSPTTDSCAGWHNFFDPANANRMDAKMLGLIAGDAGCDLEPCGQAWLDAHFTMNQDPEPATTPATGVGDTYEFIGGVASSLFLGGVLDATYDGAYAGAVIGQSNNPAPFPALFDYYRYRDGDGDDTIWSATVPVYGDGETCENPSGAIPILGFAQIVVRMPNPPPDSTVSVTVDCNQSYEPGRGGGTTGEYGGLRGTIPNLVE